jgi:hypothetical protein
MENKNTNHMTTKVFFSIWWGRHTCNDLQEKLAKFGYRSKMQIFFFQATCYFGEVLFLLSTYNEFIFFNLKIWWFSWIFFTKIRNVDLHYAQPFLSTSIQEFIKKKNIV